MEHLPKIVRGEIRWCQGYSEPNAGSDLASLQTSATPDGDDYIINGSKIWTSLAQDANHMFLLARTDKEAKLEAVERINKHIIGTWENIKLRNVDENPGAHFTETGQTGA